MKPPSARTAFPVKLVHSDDSASPACEKALTEKELKLVTTNGSDEPFNLFLRNLKHGRVPGIELVHKGTPRRIITRQIDTADNLLKKQGITLRIRGSYDNGEFTDTDINIKTPKEATGVAMERGEYEDRISSGSLLNVEAIENSPKYKDRLAKGLLPDLQEALDLIKDLRAKGLLEEKFLIDVYRQAHVIRLDSAIAGLNADQTFYGELLKDTMVYIKRGNGRTHMIAPDEGRHEMEIEPIHKPCEFNHYKGCEKHVSINLTSDDENIALDFLKNSIIPFGSDNAPIIMPKHGKAGRGFKLIADLQEDFSPAATPGLLKTAFDQNALIAPPVGNLKDIPLKMQSPAVLNVPSELRVLAA